MTKAVILGAALFATTSFAAGKFKLESKDVKANGTLTDAQLYKGFGCEGGNVSPQLSWSNPPEGTKSFAVSLYDPDAPTGSGFWHWYLYNIPATTLELPGGAGSPGGKLPEGTVAVKNDFGVKDFGGACPPQGDKAHRYIFTVYALKTDKLEVPPDASPALVGFFVHGATLGKATLEAKYSRPKAK